MCLLFQETVIFTNNMKLSELKRLTHLLEMGGVNDDFDLTFTHTIDDGSKYGLTIEEFELESPENNGYDIGHSSKIVNIFLKEKEL